MNQKLVIQSVILALSIFVVDQVLKIQMREWLLDPARQMVITPYFNLTPVWNHGISFGLFQSEEKFMRWVLVGVAAGISTLVVMWLLQAKTRFEAYSLGLILGGAVGNIIDRILFGAVFDFLDFHFKGWHYPAFNIADASICTGVVLYVLARWRVESQGKKQQQAVTT